ncbi:Alpha/Beta hydrolase protein, partial [Cunninghamella echinulata]
VIICHGLFGSKQNWKSLAKAMGHRLKRDIYALDLRNHGESGHALPHTYQVMANDVKQWLEDNKIENPILLGHSM